MTKSELKSQLDYLYELYHKPEFINNDPILFPHRYSDKKDIEIVALLTATIAWGKRSMILNSCEKLFSYIGYSPYDYVMDKAFLKFDYNKNIHRTFFGRDFVYLCKGLQELYSSHSSMESLFLSSLGDTWDGIGNLRSLFINANDGMSSIHISNPSTSACKRLHMMLRWLARQNSCVDLGIWKNVDNASLQIPLDVHVARTAELLKLTSRKSNDRKKVEEISNNLRTLCPNDPIRYDFALFGYGVNLK